MRFLVARTSSFRDREPWGENVDVVDELRSVEVRGGQVPAWLRPVVHRWIAFSYALKLLWRSRLYDAISVGRQGVWLPILLRLFGSSKRIVMTDVEWPRWGTGIINCVAGNAASAICCNTHVEMERYSRTYKVPAEKFRFVPMAFQKPDMRETSDGGYIFAGGNQARDWRTFFEAVGELPYPVRCFTTQGGLPRVPPNVTIASVAREEFYNQMAAASCVVVPVVKEPLRVTGPTTWINAMGMGKVVIVTEPEGAADYMESGVSGFYVNHGDAEALRECVVMVMQDGELRKRVGEAARKRAETEFSPEVFRRRVLWLLEAGLDGKGGSA